VSIRISGRRAPQRLLALLSAGVIIAGLTAATPAATAANAPSQGSDTVVTGNGVRYSDGRYVVLLREPSAARYNGENARFRATRPRPGGQFRADSAAVRAYTSHLRSTQAALAREVGARPMTSYTIATNGFSSRLTGDQALELATDRRVLLVARDTRRSLDTWNTPHFLGLTGKNGAWTTHGGQRRAGAGVVVGDLDSGAWPESKSFAGRPLTSAPKTKWDISRVGTATRMEKRDGGVFHGQCQLGEKWTADDCNTKLIGARYYPDAFLDSIPPEDRAETEFLSTRDGDGHGTHTASTAAGNRHVKARVEGRSFGEVSGMAPAARLAIYKVCFFDNDPDSGDCYTSSSLEAIDDAIADGVDVINYSISGATDTVIDAVELAFEGAAEANVFVSTSAGNSGPDTSTVAHNSPWLSTVAATTHHNFENTLVLGNGRRIVGASIAEETLGVHPLVSAEDVAASEADPEEASLCGPDTLDPAKVAGKIVVCLRGVFDRVAKSAEVERAGGVGMVLANPTPNSLDADFHAVPTIHIDATGTARVMRYLESAGSRATAQFRLGNITKKVTPLPQIAGFSSRGPALANDSDLLKPDISAPGVSVLAAVAPPSNSHRRFDLYSGTSMAAPHITGLAAFMMGVHPNWSAQQVKSAMMTTARRVKTETGSRSKDLFAQGSGIVTPKKFFDPGLFVTSTPREWQGFITGQGLDSGVPALAAKDVNVPSMAQGQVTSATSFTRRFVASRKGTWKVSVKVPGFRSTPSRTTLVSKRRGDIEHLKLDFARTDAPLGEFAFGYLKLTGPTRVSLPIALRPVSVKAPAQVEGTGVAGAIDVPITAGFTGDLTVGTTGLAKARTDSASVATGDDHFTCVTVSETSKVARFDLDADDDGADLDMFVLQSDTCDPNTAFALAGQAATGSADESLTINDPAPGTYIVQVNGFAAGPQGSPMEFDLDFYDVNDAATLGNLTVVPNPVPVRNQETTSFQLSWSGLVPNGRYLGYLDYEGALAPTVVKISS
jgi:hypothetical protein